MRRWRRDVCRGVHSAHTFITERPSQGRQPTGAGTRQTTKLYSLELHSRSSRQITQKCSAEITNLHFHAIPTAKNRLVSLLYQVQKRLKLRFLHSGPRRNPFSTLKHRLKASFLAVFLNHTLQQKHKTRLIHGQIL